MTTRRDMLETATVGLGITALNAMLGSQSALGDQRTVVSSSGIPSPHFAPRAKRVIFLFMQGGPSHIDTFDYKPDLAAMAEKEKRSKGNYFPSPFRFRQHGDSGLPISDVIPFNKHADDLCLLNGMHTDNPAHPQATIMLHTGSVRFVRPSVGSWVTYGLGTENENLPGFVTINPPTNLGGAQNYGSAFLPATYQATKVNADKNPISNINSSLAMPQQRRQIDFIQQMNRDLLKRHQANEELEGIIESYELAFRMQSSVPELVDLASESESTKRKYGIDAKPTATFGRQCLMARRLAEAGVRFIQISHRGWDQHKDLKKRLQVNGKATDQPIAALLSDLKSRGMLEETLVVWGGEFGRQPRMQNNGGRAHNHRGYTMWLAGGGIKGGMRYGATDPSGQNAISNKVHTHDLHATMLHLLGLDHERLTYRYSGRDFRLTDVYGNVLHDIIS